MGCAASISTPISTSLSSDTIGAFIGCLVRDHARARLASSPDQLLGYRRPRQSSQRCADSPAPAAAPKNCDRDASRRIETRKTRTQPCFGFDPPALDIEEPGTTG